MEEFALRIVFVLFGLIFAGIGWFLLWRQKKLKQVCTAQVSGTVKDVTESISHSTGKGKRTGRRRVSYRPIFTYSVEGVEYVQQSIIGSSRPKFNVGQSVTVFYDPSSPKRFYVLEEGKSTVAGICFVAVGVVIMIATPFLDYMG